MKIQLFLEFIKQTENIIYTWIQMPSSEEDIPQRIQSLLSDGVRFQPNDVGGELGLQKLSDHSKLEIELYNKYPYAVSTTRNNKFKYGSRTQVRVSMSRDKVADSYCIRPLQHSGEYAYGWRNSNGESFGNPLAGQDKIFKKREWEERVYSKNPGFISPKIFLKIEVSSKYYDSFMSLENPYNIDIVLNNDILKLNTRGE